MGSEVGRSGEEVVGHRRRERGIGGSEMSALSFRHRSRNERMLAWKLTLRPRSFSTDNILSHPTETTIPSAGTSPRSNRGS